MHKCPYCGNEYNNYTSLGKHTSRTHKIKKEQLALDMFHNGINPKCKCGCGEPLNYMARFKDTGYYGSYLRGHISRIKNNWGHNQSAIDNSTETRRTRFETGEIKVWNDGLTKETDNRVLENTKKSKKSINSNPKELKRRATHMKKMRNNDIRFQSKFGKESANWKGGTSPINSMIRSNKRLYTDWIYPILIEQRFTCQECNSTKKLEVHHDKETMAEIIQKFVSKEDEYTFDEKRDIMNKVIDYHIENQVSGKTLCNDCHKELHPSYNC